MYADVQGAFYEIEYLPQVTVLNTHIVWLIIRRFLWYISYVLRTVWLYIINLDYVVDYVTYLKTKWRNSSNSLHFNPHKRIQFIVIFWFNQAKFHSRLVFDVDRTKMNQIHHSSLNEVLNIFYECTIHYEL